MTLPKYLGGNTTYMRRLIAVVVLWLGTAPAAAQPELAWEKAQRAFANGDYQTAIALLDSVETPTSEGYYLLGRAYQELLRHDRAADTFHHADTADARVLIAWGHSLDRLGRTPDALARYEQAYRQDSTDARAAMPLARLYAEADRWSKVKTIFTRLLEGDPNNPFLRAQLGNAYRALDSTDAAIVHYERAHRLDPQSIEVPLNLSGVYLATGKLIAARRVMERALERHPRHPALWRRRGKVAQEEEMHDVAVEAFQNALAYGDSTAAAFRDLGMAFYLNGDYEHAAAPLRTSFRADSAHAATAFYLGVTKQQLGRHDAALRYLSAATVLYGKSKLAEVYVQLAETRRSRDEYPEAVRADRLALRLNPEKTDVLFHLATLYDEYYADPATALAHYKLFLQTGATYPLRQAWAARRIKEIEEAEFFRGRPVRPASDSSGQQKE